MYLDFLSKQKVYLYLVFRVVIGYLFFQHGAQKLFGWFGSKGTVELMSLMGLAGVLELLVGLALLLGLFSRLAALGGVAVMLGALFKVHLPQALNPALNGGELAVLYLASFLVLLAHGNGIWSLEKYLLKKELF